MFFASTFHRLPVFAVLTMASKKGTGQLAKNSVTTPTPSLAPKPKPKPKVVQKSSSSCQQTSAGTITLPPISNKNTQVLADPANEDTDPLLAILVATQETSNPPQSNTVNAMANPRPNPNDLTSARQQTSTSTKTTTSRQTGNNVAALCVQLAAAEGKPFLLYNIMMQLTF